MAEQYLCKSEIVNFSNGGAELLQNLWVAELKNLKEKKYTNELIKNLISYNNLGLGTKAYGIDGIHEDYNSVIPLTKLLLVNSKLILNFNDNNWVEKEFNKHYPISSINLWKSRLTKISEAIENEIVIANEKYDNN